MKEIDKSIVYGILLGVILLIPSILFVKLRPNNPEYLLIYLVLLMILVPSSIYTFYNKKYGKSPKTITLYRNVILSAFESFSLIIAMIFVYVSYLSSSVPVPETTLIQVSLIIFVVWFIVFFITWKYRNK
jgi:hypothetical protein